MDCCPMICSDRGLMITVFMLDIAFSIAGATLSFGVLDEINSNERLLNGRLSMIAGVVFSLNIATGILAGIYFSNMSKKMHKQNEVVHCKLSYPETKIKIEPHRIIDLCKNGGCCKLTAIVIAALGYLGMPYAIATTQIQMWLINGTNQTSPDLIYDQVYNINWITYLVTSLKFIEFVIGHGWAVACDDASKLMVAKEPLTGS